MLGEGCDRGGGGKNYGVPVPEEMKMHGIQSQAERSALGVSFQGGREVNKHDYGPLIGEEWKPRLCQVWVSCPLRQLTSL